MSQIPIAWLINIIEVFRATKMENISMLHDESHAEQERDSRLDFGGNQVLRAAMYILEDCEDLSG